MRWFVRTVVGVLIVLSAPAPAHAWFQWLDYLSGPGPFYGPKLDVRVWCSGSKAIGQKIQDAEVLLEAALARSFDSNVRDVPGEWGLLVTRLEEIDKEFPVIKPGVIGTLRARVGQLTPPDIVRYRQYVVARARTNEQSAQSQPLEPSAGAAPLLLSEVIWQAEKTFDQLYRAQVAVASAGIFISFCPPGKQREFAVEVGVAPLQAYSDPDFAADYTIRFTAITGGVSWRPHQDPTRDLFDVGVNAGIYRFSSRGFNAFRGLLLEPFVDVHGPSAWVNQDGLRKIASLVTIRGSLVMFPTGLQIGKFAPGPNITEEISGWDPTPSLTIYFDLSPLLRHRGRLFATREARN